jgi:hypothetical protein
MAVGLVQMSDELNNPWYRTADHDPESKIYFQHERHRASPLFDFRGLEQPTPWREQKFQYSGQTGWSLLGRRISNKIGRADRAKGRRNLNDLLRQRNFASFEIKDLKDIERHASTLSWFWAPLLQNPNLLRMGDD